jgi:hypothetical protein
MTSFSCLAPFSILTSDFVGSAFVRIVQPLPRLSRAVARDEVVRAANHAVDEARK